MTAVKCPRCPLCDRPPIFAVSLEQAFCGNAECDAFSWDATRTREENLDGVNVIDLSGIDPDA